MIPRPPPYYYNVHHAQYINQERRKKEARRSDHMNLEDRTEPTHYEPTRQIVSKPSYKRPEPKPEDDPNFAGYDYALKGEIIRPLAKVLTGICAVGTLAAIVSGIYCINDALPYNESSDDFCMGAVVSLSLVMVLGAAAGKLYEKLTEKVPYYYMRK